MSEPFPLSPDSSGDTLSSGGNQFMLPRHDPNTVLSAGEEVADRMQDPRTPEQWHRVAVTAMTIIADLGSERAREEGATLDPHQSIPIPNKGTARIEFHEGHTDVGHDKYGGTFEAAPHQKVVKVEPLPRMPIPPARAPFALMKQAAAEYDREVAQEAEITWSSLDEEVIIVARRTAEAIARSNQREEETFTPYAVLAKEAAEAGADTNEIMSLMSDEDIAAREQSRLDELPVEEQIRYCEILRGAATMAALAANRPDLVARLQVLWGPELPYDKA